MNPSLFSELVAKYFPALVLNITERFNDENRQPDYMFRRYLRKDFSIDGKWATITEQNSLVAADIIAMDSSIPLKKRPSLGVVSGDIPKLGLEFAINETQQTEINTLMALQARGGATEAMVASRLFRDVSHAIGGQYERIEAMFLEGLSSGVVEISDAETVGTGIRINYGYQAENAFTSGLPWSNVAATPITDMQPVLDQAANDGNPIMRVMMDRTTFNNLAKSAEGKEIYAAAFGIFGTSVPVPTFDQMNTALRQRFGWDIEIVDRVVRIQKNGVNVAVRPWKAGAVVFLTDMNVGSYVYARLAEQDRPVGGVNYQVVDDFMLVSRYSMNRPSLKEITNSQSRVVPVISNPYAIYTLDSTVTAG